MKFIIAVVMLAATAAAQVLPLPIAATWGVQAPLAGAAPWAGAIAPWAGVPAGIAPWAGAVAPWGGLGVAAGPWGGVAAAPWVRNGPWNVPAAVGVPAPLPAVPGVGVPGASYVAANRGSVHVAPLPGHINSASSVNLAPAPGTW